jgi:hypothetical protein
MKPPISSSVALSACGTLTSSASCRACCACSKSCGPICSADSAPARWAEATCVSAWPVTFRSSALTPGWISPAGRLTSCG